MYVLHESNFEFVHFPVHLSFFISYVITSQDITDCLKALLMPIDLETIDVTHLIKQIDIGLSVLTYQL